MANEETVVANLRKSCIAPVEWMNSLRRKRANREFSYSSSFARFFACFVPNVTEIELHTRTEPFTTHNSSISNELTCIILAVASLGSWQLFCDADLPGLYTLRIPKY